MKASSLDCLEVAACYPLFLLTAVCAILTVPTQDVGGGGGEAAYVALQLLSDQTQFADKLTDYYLRTPLHIAQAVGDPVLFDLLATAGRPHDLKGTEDILETVADPLAEICDYDFRTPLHGAIFNQNATTVELQSVESDEPVCEICAAVETTRLRFLAYHLLT